MQCQYSFCAPKDDLNAAEEMVKVHNIHCTMSWTVSIMMVTRGGATSIRNCSRPIFAKTVLSKSSNNIFIITDQLQSSIFYASDIADISKHQGSCRRVCFHLGTGSLSWCCQQTKCPLLLQYICAQTRQSYLSFILYCWTQQSLRHHNIFWWQRNASEFQSNV